VWPAANESPTQLGIWKKATGDAANLRNKTTRDGTFNEDLTEMVGP